jgi:hypothetical protein
MKDKESEQEKSKIGEVLPAFPCYTPSIYIVLRGGAFLTPL